jgi:autotransporter-associated beta strand protein/T5SS/PEP-CTERM-associated repeat protein
MSSECTLKTVFAACRKVSAFSAMKGILWTISVLICLTSNAWSDVLISGDVTPANPAQWSISYGGSVGINSTGSVTINGGSALGSESTLIGYNSGGQGTVTITDSGSRMTSLATLVGYSGSGVLNVLQGGTLSGYSGYLAYNAGSTGAVTISGSESSWSVQNTLTLAKAGNSTLTLDQGGTLRVNTLQQGTGTSDFYWNDGTIQNWNGNTIISGMTIKLAESGSHIFNIGSSNTGTVNATLIDATHGGSLTKIGTGRLFLTAANTYSGATTIDQGICQVTGSILDTSGIDINQTGSLELANSSISATSASVPIDNDGNLVVRAGSQNAGTITGSGTTRVNAGATLTAASIVQKSLIIGGASASAASSADISPANQVPEPSAIALIFAGLLGILLPIWRRKLD